METIKNKKTYLMHPNQFYDLCNVHGFNNLNGDTYVEHVVIILNLDGELKEKVLVEDNYDDLMNILKNNNIEITHQVEDDYDDLINILKT